MGRTERSVEESISADKLGRGLRLEPGEKRTMVLTDLEPGRYAMLCCLLDADGTPHCAKGMRAEFAIE